MFEGIFGLFNGAAAFGTPEDDEVVALALLALDGVEFVLAGDACTFEKIIFFALPPILIALICVFFAPGGRPRRLAPVVEDGFEPTASPLLDPRGPNIG